MMTRLFPIVGAACLSGVLGLLPPTTASAAQAGASPVRIFIMAGQSNMLGKGTISPATTPGTLEYLVANDTDGSYQFLVDEFDNWIVRDDVWIRDQDPVLGGLAPGFGGEASGLIGPELGFGHKIGDVNGNQVLIVKCAWGGKDLAFNFCPPSSRPGDPEPTNSSEKGFYYKEILRLVNEATTNLGSYFPDYDGQGYEIAGFCWHQGWNDRVDAAKSAAYESNMVNFINDIRNDLGTPNLPFVIATTGMDGLSGYGYTTVEKAQLKMADTTAYPAFDGNVAVIDTRATYEGLTFWQPVSESPANEGYHWNRNAKSYLHIGLAMGDAMSLISPGRCPYRLRSSGGAGGVTLTWQNGTETPTSVRVLRNGVEIAASAPANPPTFTDASAPIGTHDYELQFTMPGDPCDPLTHTHDSSIHSLTAKRRIQGVKLNWQNNHGYTAIKVSRNGDVIAAALPADTTEYTDHSPPAGNHTYAVEPTDAGTTAATVQITVSAAPTGTAVIYEPFDMPVGEPLNEQKGGIGIDGTWVAGNGVEVTSGNLTFGSLPVFGNHIIRTTSNGTCSIDIGDSLSEAGLLDHGAELWFSFLCPNPNNINVSPNLVLGSDALLSTTSVSGGGSAIGVVLNQGKWPQAKIFSSGGVAATSSNQSTLGTSELALIVGRITWGANASLPDVIEVYTPGADLVLDTPVSTSSIVDQSTFHVLSTWGNGTAPNIDEIRFGATYDDVVGQGVDTSDDFTAPSPSPMTFASPPAAVSDTSVTMTATTATDTNGVEYYFTCTAGGGHNSGWQDEPVYTDTGLTASTQYTYSVKARDKSLNQNQTLASGTASATTQVIDTNPPPTPAFDMLPTAISYSEITMSATAVIDGEGNSVEYYFTCTGGGGNDSGWQTELTYTDSGLTPSTEYTYTVKARDTATVPNESAPSSPESATTDEYAPTDGTWVFDSDGVWSDAGKWQDGIVADGPGSNAYLTADITAGRLITLDTNRTIGNLTFTDQPNNNNNLSIVGPSTLTMEVLSGTPIIDVTQSARRLTINTPIAGNDGLQKNGPGLLLLGGTNSWSGTTIVNEGQLDFQGTSLANVSGGSGRNIQVNSGARVRFSSLSNAILNRLVESSDEFGVFTGSTSNHLDFSSNTGADLPNAFLGHWSSNGGKTQYDGTITPASDAYRIGYTGTSGTLGITQPMTGNQGLIIGGGSVILTAANTFSGDTTIRSGGRLFFGKPLCLQNSILDLGSSGGTICFSSGTATGPISGDTASPNPTIGGLAGSRNFATCYNSGNQNNTGRLTITQVTGLTLNVADGVTTSYSGIIPEMAVGTTLTMIGPGTQILTGANTFTGATTINNGTLQVNGSLAAGSAVQVNGGTLAGTGTIGGSVTAGSSGNLSPGASAGVLSIGGNLDLSALASGTGKLVFELNALAATNDRIHVTGTLAMGNGNLGVNDFTFIDLGGVEPGTYTLISSSGITGSLSAGQVATTIGGANATLQVNNNNLELVVAPSNPFAVWSGGADADADTNQDGVDNAVAWVLGAASPAENAVSLLPTFTQTTGDLDRFDFVFRRADDALNDANTSIIVEYDSTMTGWTTASPGPSISIIENDDFYDTGVDQVIVRIHKNLVGDTKNFVRLRAVVTTP